MNVYLLGTLLFIFGCTEPTNNGKSTPEAISIDNINTAIDSSSSILHTRFLAPVGYITTQNTSESFAHYLQTLPLKPIDAEVKYYDGRTKANETIYCAVIDQDIDPVDLQQCADAVMRLRGEYLFEQKRFDEIKFNFLSDGKPRYFGEHANGDYSYAKFRKYMKYIFSYANTGSMCDELSARAISDMQIGDVFVQKGRPYGHAVIVVNMASDSLGNKKYMLAQSYMPAQETQVLIDPLSEDKTPWFTLEDDEIITPQWTFQATDLKHF
ncbi:MAG: DUF4846 domain-containing protein [Bacteroidia bacterium]|jgi:hypothetical protein|tara:strand:+ start:7476 stop:8279 length:804 start_codon:yes stop_codon:yes gene_type:complete